MSTHRRLPLSLVRALGYALGRSYLFLFRWTLVGRPPDVAKHVMIAAPHTSNWDLVIMLACGWTYGCSFHWLGKKEIFRMPIVGPFLRWTGGIPIDRGTSQDTVAQAVRAFAEATHMHLAVSPEGTRSHRHHWRSGFYHIALGAKVPIAFGFIDYATRRAGYGPLLMPTGDVRADMDAVRAFYAPIGGKYPEKQAPIRLPAEDEPAEGPGLPSP